MISTYARVAARLVRLAAAVCVVGLLVGYVAVSSFASRYGSASPVLDTKSGMALSVAVLAQKSAGLTCVDEPGRSDVVLFQRVGAAEVTVLTYDDAMRASRAREGSIRRYCSAP